MNLPVNMAMPDFMIIGTQRGGTTSLYNYLLAHPQIVAATKKEIHFFDKKFQRGIPWYRAQFPSLIQSDMGETIGRQGVITGEASPYYLFHPHAPARAALVVPKTKLIVLLRNPVDRAESVQQRAGLEVGGTRRRQRTHDRRRQCDFGHSADRTTHVRQLLICSGYVRAAR